MIGVAMLSLVLQAAGASPTPAVDAASLLGSGDFSGARLAYENELQTHPADLQAQQGEVQASEQLALAARASHDMNSALGELLRAQRFAPDNPRLLYDLAVLEDEIGLYQDADRTTTHLQQLTPGEAKIAYLVARVKLDSGQLPGAETAMLAYLKAEPLDATAHYGLGRAYQLQQKTDQARAEFIESLRLKPDQTESHYQLADMALKAGSFEEAISEARKVIARNPQHGGALTDMGVAFFREKKYPQAVEALEQAISVHDSYQTSHYYLGLALARVGRKDESAQQLALAAQMADKENQQDARHLHVNP